MVSQTDKKKGSRTPIVVVFRGAEYKVEPLAVKDSRLWREKVVLTLGDLSKYAEITPGKPNEFKEALQALLIAMPNTVVDLFFEYAKGLNREEIEAIATDEEMAVAFGQVAKVAFTLSKSLGDAMAVLGR